MKRFLKKALIYLIMTVLVLPISAITGVLSAQKAKAAAMPAVVINEFVSNGSPEWVELLNTTNSPVDLSGWHLTDLTSPSSSPVEENMISLNGTIAANGIVAFDGSSSLNNAGDSIGLYNGDITNPANLVYRVSYGNVAEPYHTTNDGYVSAPGSGSSAAYLDGTWGISIAPTKGLENGPAVNQYGFAFSTIQKALDAANSGDTITIQPGTYNETLIINKAVSITSSGAVTVNEVDLSAGATLTNVKANIVSVGTGVDVNKGFAILNDNGYITIPDGNYQTYLIVNKPFHISAPTGATFTAIALKSNNVNLTNINSDVVVVGSTASINSAIAAANTDGTVEVLDGDYTENVIINKNITLVGEPQKFPTLASVGTAISVSSSKSMISGLKIQNSGTGILINNAGTHTIVGNIFENNTEDVNNNTTSQVDASGNFWGVNGPDNSKILNNGGSTITSPWYLEEGMINYRFSTGITPDGNTIATVTSQIGTYNDLPEGRVTVEIPSNTTITGSSTWDGELTNGTDAILPAGTNIAGLGQIVQNINTIELGSVDNHLQFSNPVKVTFSGAAGKFIGFMNGNTFSPITTDCGSDLANPTLSSTFGECKTTVGNDLVVFTKHFTKFVTYNSSAIVITAPTNVVAKIVQSGSQSHINVSWTAVSGVDGYTVSVNNGVTVDLNSAATSYDSANINPGNFTASVKAYKLDSLGNKIYSIAATSNTVTYTQTTAQPLTTTTPTVAPQKAKAAASSSSVVEPSPAAAQSTPSDNQGIVKGDNTKTADNTTNWTPWIILFVLILFAGAATGGYFYWFAGKEEDEVVTVKKTPIVKKEKSGVTVRTKDNGNKKSPNKKPKRW